ncbi:SDR family oxidoreductase [Nocardioides sp. SYSU D00038]|uniref:SDR family NAD(P)-dependent oxidoreductase n=1 Tax=Nocardioides sp. SYSU D00038 TaxID=2812554 RepID=UPI0019677694|nr:SDR family NAD(P)-dependent oxidoreductase [Nocardioides sp. SYSU D00038]
MSTPDPTASIPAPLAVVTGASTGIGRSLAGVLAEHGYDLVLAADEPQIHEAARDLSSGGRSVRPVEVDLATSEGVQALLAEVGEQPVAIAALNAGVGANGRFDQVPLEDDLTVVDLNVRSTVHLAKAFVRSMVARGEGRVLITSSVAAVAPGPYQATYAASKAFVHSFAEGIRQELKDTGVTVTSLMPGPTDTEFFSRADMEDTRLGQMDGKDDPDEVARDAYDALVAGKPHVTAGSFLNRVQAELGTHLPDAIATPLLARLTKPRD